MHIHWLHLPDTARKLVHGLQSQIFSRVTRTNRDTFADTSLQVRVAHQSESPSKRHEESTEQAARK